MIDHVHLISARTWNIVGIILVVQPRFQERQRQIRFELWHHVPTAANSQKIKVPVVPNDVSSHPGFSIGSPRAPRSFLGNSGATEEIHEDVLGDEGIDTGICVTIVDQNTQGAVNHNMCIEGQEVPLGRGVDEALPIITVKEVGGDRDVQGEAGAGEGYPAVQGTAWAGIIVEGSAEVGLGEQGTEGRGGGVEYTVEFREEGVGALFEDVPYTVVVEVVAIVASYLVSGLIDQLLAVRG